MMLAEHATTAPNGLINVLNGGATNLNRPAFPAPMNVAFVGIVNLEGYENGTEVNLEVTVTSPDETEVFARIEGVFASVIEPDADLRATSSPLVVDLQAVHLSRPGLYKVNATFAGSDTEAIYFQVRRVEPGVVPVEIGGASRVPGTPAPPS